MPDSQHKDKDVEKKQSDTQEILKVILVSLKGVQVILSEMLDSTTMQLTVDARTLLQANLELVTQEIYAIE